MIARTPEDRRLYDARMKFLHDVEGRLIAARKDGLVIGALAGKIQVLQQFLGEPEESLDELLQRDSASLTALLEELQGRLRLRGA